MKYENNTNKADKTYYGKLLFAALIGFCFIVLRSRFGVDLSDDTWYTTDPYMVAKGAVPYVNNWTQASGFTLPLAICHYLYMKLTGGSEGIVLFTRILYCVWKSLVVVLTFAIFRRAKLQIPALLAILLIVFAPDGLYAINYNSIGITYVLLCFSLICLLMDSEKEATSHNKMIIGIFCGIIMGRCVIGTPISLVACISFFFILLIYKNYSGLKGYVLGGIIAAISVIGYCCVKEGVEQFAIGIQYFFKDISYYEYLSEHKVSVTDNLQYAMIYILPAICTLLLVFILRVITNKKEEFFNKTVIWIAVVMLFFAIYNLSGYTGTTISTEGATRFGWYIPVICAFYKCEKSSKKGLQLCALYALIAFLLILSQLKISSYGLVYRSYWNFSPIVLGIADICLCIEDTYNLKGLKLYFYKSAVVLAVLMICVFMVRGSYMYVYRDFPIDNLTTKVEAGTHKGCLTTSSRAESIIELEQNLKNRSSETDKVFCWGGYQCYMNLLCNGIICSPSPLGTGERNGFDYWHMYHSVPDKVFACINKDWSKEIKPKTHPVWIFIDSYYIQTDEFDFSTYNSALDLNEYKIVEYELSNPKGALSYADKMATKVYEFK